MTTVLLTYLFSPDIWGTVSDWVMVGVTALTAILLLITLKSQREVQKTQNELFRIESIRFRESIKPILNYSASTGKMKPEEEDKKILTVEVTNETNRIALNISKIVADSEQTKQIFIPLGFSDRRDHLTKGDNPLLFHFLIDSKSRVSGWVIFTLKYQDIAGTKYKQGVICICDDYGIEINPYLPEIITTDEDERKFKQPE